MMLPRLSSATVMLRHRRCSVKAVMVAPGHACTLWCAAVGALHSPSARATLVVMAVGVGVAAKLTNSLVGYARHSAGSKRHPEARHSQRLLLTPMPCFPQPYRQWMCV